MLCNVMLCYAMLCNVMSCHVMLYVRMYVYMYNRSTTNHVLYVTSLFMWWGNSYPMVIFVPSATSAPSASWWSEAGGMAPEVAVVAQALFDHAMVGAQDTATVGNPGWMAVEGFCQSQAPSFWHIIPREWWILPYMDGRYFCTCHVLYCTHLHCGLRLQHPRIQRHVSIHAECWGFC